MTVLQAWLTKPRANVRIHTSVRWGGLIGILRQLSSRRRDVERPRLEVIDRLSLGGKKSLLMVAIGNRNVLVAVGDAGAPSITPLDASRPFSGSTQRKRTIRSPRARRTVSR